MIARRCPKCKGIPSILLYDFDLKYHVECHRCGFSSEYPDMDRDEAIANWNIIAVGYEASPVEEK